MLSEVYEFQAQLDALAKDCGGWRNMPAEAFDKLVAMYMDDSTSVIVGKAFADNKEFQDELSRRTKRPLSGSSTRQNEPAFSGNFLESLSTR